MNDDKKQSSIIIYGTSWCQWCPRAKAHFDKEGLPYVYHDIEADTEARAELEQKLGGPVQGVPVLDVNNHIIMGYDVASINKALAV